MRSTLTRFIIAALTSACLVFAATLQAQVGGEARETQRELYLAAQEAWLAGRTQEYQSLYAQLGDYPLRIYLDYTALAPKVAGLALPSGSNAPIDSFLANYPDTYLAERMERTWVNLLALQKRWADVERYYNPQNTTTTLRCYSLEARLHQGDQSAMAEVASLWNVARSQPNECDPLFEMWLAADGLTPQIAWQRFVKTLESGSNPLARYIQKLMPERESQLAQRFLNVDRNPSVLRDFDAFSDPLPEVKEMVNYGLRQLAVSNPALAMSLIEPYAERLNFDVQQRQSLQRYAVQRMQVRGDVEESERLLTLAPELITESLAAWIIRDALRSQDWARVEAWLDRLPEQARSDERWQYWQARVLLEKGGDVALAQAQSLRQVLATKRSYFGFLAAGQLGINYDMAEQPVIVGQEQLNELYAIPAIERAYELYLLGDEQAARSEWQYATASLSEEQTMASGKLAESWGWHRNAIQAMIRIQHWDDLQLRFPLAYADTFNSTAKELGLSQQLIYAIARQESAFMQDVRSPAGAMGLMQLMPATGRETAATMGMRISNQDLLIPETNIALGARYLSSLLKNFDGNRILAAAAYNAGPNRVRQWLQRTADAPVPFDIWIETIPFGETRNYVESVLTYSVIYGYRMGEQVALLTDQEIEFKL